MVNPTLATPSGRALFCAHALLIATACRGSTSGDPAAAGSTSVAAGAGGWSPTARNESRTQPQQAGTADPPPSGAGGIAAGSSNAAGGVGSAAAGAGGLAAGSGGSAGSTPGASAGGAAAGQSGVGPAAGSGGANGPPSGPSRCPNPDLLLCDGFESGIDKTTWRNKLAAPTVDDMHVARGAKALHVHTGATSGAGLETSKLFPSLPGHYYGRMFVYFDALPTSPQWAHWTIVGSNPVAGSSDQSEIRVGGQHDGKIERFGVGTDHGPTGDWTNLDQDPAGGAMPVPLKRWLCIEWLHDWERDETRFYLDGVEHPSLHTTRDVKHPGSGNQNVKFDIPQLGSMWVGFWNYDQGKAVTPTQFDTWIDEVALDDERIGCDR